MVDGYFSSEKRQEKATAAQPPISALDYTHTVRQAERGREKEFDKKRTNFKYKLYDGVA